MDPPQQWYHVNARGGPLSWPQVWACEANVILTLTLALNPTLTLILT